MQRLIHWGLTFIASLLLIIGLLLLLLPGPAVIFLGLGIYLFGRLHPGKLDPWVRGFIRLNRRAAQALDSWITGLRNSWKRNS